MKLSRLCIALRAQITDDLADSSLGPLAEFFLCYLARVCGIVNGLAISRWLSTF